MSKCWYCNEELTTANYSEEHIGICTKCYGSMFKVSNEFVKGLMDKIADLEAKLADKEKEIEEYADSLSKVLIEEANLSYKHNQDKISFCIEQLNLFKSELVNKVSPVNLSYTEYVQEVFKKINNQIKQLKEKICN